MKNCFHPSGGCGYLTTAGCTFEKKCFYDDSKPFVCATPTPAHALAYCTQERRDGCECYVDGVCTHACVVAAAPSDGLRTAELKKHRHKLPDDGYEARYTEYFTCSHCKKMAYGGDELNFCPNCGRKFVKAALAQTEKEEKK